VLGGSRFYKIYEANCFIDAEKNMSFFGVAQSLASNRFALDHSLPRLKFGSKSNKSSVALNLVPGGFSQFLPNLYHKF
jgi:hypothetical protein